MKTSKRITVTAAVLMLVLTAAGCVFVGCDKSDEALRKNSQKNATLIEEEFGKFLSMVAADKI